MSFTVQNDAEMVLWGVKRDTMIICFLKEGGMTLDGSGEETVRIYRLSIELHVKNRRRKK